MKRLKQFIARWVMVIASGSMTAPAAAQTIRYTPPAGGVNGGVTNSFTVDQYFKRVCFPATTPDVGLERDSAGIVRVTDCGVSPVMANLWGSVLLAGDAPKDALAGGNIPFDTIAGTYPVPIFAVGNVVKRNVTSVANRQAANISHLIVNAASPTNRIQRAYYGAVEAASTGDSTGGRYRAGTFEVYHWDTHTATEIMGARAEVWNGVYNCGGLGPLAFCGGGRVTNAFGYYGYVHQQTPNANSPIDNAYGMLFTVDSNSNASPITNAYGVSGWVFGDAADNGAVKNISVANGGDFEVQAAASGGTISTATGVYQTVTAPAGAITLAYGNYIDAVQGTTKWAYYNNEASAPSLSKSNWRAPFHASEASSVLSVASNTIAPTNTVHHVGAGLIKTVTVPTMCAPTCTIFLVPDAAFTYDATGNIVVPAGGGTATVSRAMTLVWDGTKWYPSY